MAIIFLDPGGDAVQTLGYFSANADGNVSFDTSQKVVGVGSYKCDSGAGNQLAHATVHGVLGVNRRPSLYFRYDAIPNTDDVVTEFPATNSIYSGGGFTDQSELHVDDGLYATATPTRNGGQGTAYGSFGLDGTIPLGAVIDSVKIVYEHKYDTDTSIGISRVKVRVDGVEGPDHDDGNEPMADTVMEVDVTGERGWTRADLLDGVFEVITEARRGDTDTAHTQSWDHLKVEVQYHTAVQIIDVLDSTGSVMFSVGIVPKGSGVALRFVDGAGETFDGITEIPPNEQRRISLPYALPSADNLSINVCLEGVPELSLVDRSSAGLDAPANLRYGWTTSPGANRVCWVDCVYVDDGSDLADPGTPGKLGPLVTAKLPATANADNFDTTGGTGAVNERPVNLTNYRHQSASAQLNQNYTLQAAGVGDVDLTGKTLIGHMGWNISKKSGLGGTFQFTLNGNNTTFAPTTTPAFHKVAVTSGSYPSNAAGIGVVSPTGSQDTFLYECGDVIAYLEEGSESLLPLQLLSQNSVTPVSDDVSAEPPAAYVVRSEVGSAPGAVITTSIYSVPSPGVTPQLQAVIESRGGEEVGRSVVAPGVELSASVAVIGADAEVGLSRSLNVD